jgi:hypothetical protein
MVFKPSIAFLLLHMCLHDGVAGESETAISRSPVAGLLSGRERMSSPGEDIRWEGEEDSFESFEPGAAISFSSFPPGKVSEYHTISQLSL